jgi:nitroreductase
MTTPLDTAVTDRLLSTTRAVRKRLDLERPVDRQVILDCLRLATQAPTGSNSQGWRFVVITDRGKRARLAQFYRDGSAAYRSSQQAPRDGQMARVRSSSDYLIEVIDRVPVLVIPCIYGRITDVTVAAPFFGSIMPAVWSFMLALRSRGLGSVWTTFHLAYEAETAELLGIPDNVTQAALIPVAYTIGTDFKPAVRRPIEEITYWDGWRSREASDTAR